MTIDKGPVVHREVMEEAAQIYVEKDKLRGDMWRDFPPSDKIRELHERVARITRAYERREELMPETAGPEMPHKAYEEAVIDDALDIINYSVFLIRQIREGARG